MSKIIFVSNRLPITVNLEDDEYQISESIGGLATGLKAFHNDSNNIWMGWPGLKQEEIAGREADLSQKLESQYRYVPVYLNQEDMDLYYQGFSNSTLWPLFHYFPNLTTFEESYWDGYINVNQKFMNALDKVLEPGDTVWIHDYQLMLLPGMVKDKFPDVNVGYFLHIPFPSFELFRLLPWRSELLEGLLGSDLIGFHTYDYARHFLSSVRRILGYEHDMNFIKFNNRNVKADVFPMGIDYDYFSNAVYNKELQDEINEMMLKTQKTQVILSVDRLDYTKGIPGRIQAYARFLKDNPNYREHVTMILIVAPSRTQVDLYSDLLKEIQELVSETNGEYGSLGWVPIWYFYRTFSQDNLIALYKTTDVMMVTPLRDGMNLVAKEFIASRGDQLGMLVISETAGASSELGEAVVVNANNLKETAQGIKTALEIPKIEQMDRNSIMHNRLKRYDIHRWAKDFLDKLAQQVNKSEDQRVLFLNKKENERLLDKYKKAKKRLVFLDYDGTLVGFKSKPNLAAPDEELINLLTKLKSDDSNHIVIISGRDKHTLEKWLGHLGVDLVASHGLWLKEASENQWHQTEVLDNSWKDEIRPLLEVTMDRTPGSLIEEKEFSLAWHYRKCEPELAQIRLRELRDTLLTLTSSGHLGMLEGNKVLEIKDTTINKGRTAGHFLAYEEFDFVLAAGDDTTDEDLFSVIDKSQYTIKIGKGDTQARYYLNTSEDFRALLNNLSE
ncbi:bifunctional alpha,alpha-trehalose-phosphate synthase (UDP-forming)/trehalose-phosphatase [Spirochaeta cellobiosiphila]|uniref:bifunctional alpha,alpha-trehalose-phosphate synthase (UDP-forming)/trehalose-phosphatase n=1 Tax=Spirochaeta cellobiosiphila TaxID=504483 RepID=UPI00041A7CE8|nr:bifunctional alpha,alpha-trehalose-phosphate synthase (UDP-forming)/trehalose-phosphatase [Spirochaeta cellobiosiphila]